MQNPPCSVRPVSDEAAPFQTYFYSGASCPAVIVPEHTSDPALKILRPPLAPILARPGNKRLCRSCNVLSAFAGRHTPALPAQRQRLWTLMEISIVQGNQVPYEAHECLRPHLVWTSPESYRFRLSPTSLYHSGKYLLADFVETKNFLEGLLRAFPKTYNNSGRCFSTV